MQIYLARNQVQAGPYTLTQLNNMLATKEVDLTDLMWHEGMAQWKTVGEMTNGQYHYNPNSNSSTINSSENSPENSSEPKRVTVAELYGKKDTDQSVTSTESQTESNNKSSPSPFHVSNKPNISSKSNVLTQDQSLTLANPFKRFIALVINFFLFALTFIPISSNLDPDIAYEFLTKQQNQPILSQEEQMLFLQKVFDSTPDHIFMLSGVLIAGLLFVQAVLMFKKGQSIGKLIMGIRVLDIRTKKMASPNVVLIRGLLVSIIYFFTPIGLLLALIDLVLVIIDKNKQSLHDKIAKTIVANANDNQLKD